jgi:hypothetical protein
MQIKCWRKYIENKDIYFFSKVILKKGSEFGCFFIRE